MKSMQTPDKFAALRKKAEAILESVPKSAATDQHYDLLEILHELDTHRIELELQNDELQSTNLALINSQESLREEIAVHYRHYDIAPVGYITLDDKRMIIELNQTLATMLGVEKQTLIGRSFNDIIYDLDQDIFYFCQQALMASQTLKACELRLNCQNNKTITVKLDCVLEQHKDAIRLHIAISDISHLKVIEKSLDLAATVFEKCGEAIIITDADLNIVHVNDAFELSTGYSSKEALGKTPQLLQSGRHDASFYLNMWNKLKQEQQWQGEVWSRRKDGELYPEWLSITAIRDEQNEVTHYVGMFTDITQRKNEEAQIHFMAFYDHLTLIPNRRLLEDRLNQAIALSHRNYHYGALMILDIDYFKDINDTYGHLTGDLLLQHVANRLSACVREEDTVARQGGDEFIVLLSDLGDDPLIAERHATNVAKKIISSLSESINVNGYVLQITASIGITMFPTDTDNIADLLQLADSAMYQVKRSGRNNYELVTHELQQVTNERLSLQRDLSKALEKQEFEVYYQPQINISTNKIIGVEALVRWHHPTRGLIFPHTFIWLAEESKLMAPICDWVLGQACQQFSLWQKHKKESVPYVAVNISSQHIREQNFIPTIKQVLADNDMLPHQLQLEITENVLVENAQETQKKLSYLHDMGVRIAIDNFGSGYSSLQYLNSSSVDSIKIDRSLVQNIGIVPADETRVKAAIALADLFKLPVIAEGVETEEQQAFLSQYDAICVQGFHYSEPVSGAAFLKLIEKNDREI